MKTSFGRRRGKRFTLIELLLVVAIIAILASILLPALSKARESTKRVHCINRQKQIGLTMLMYVEDNNGCLPPAWTPIYWHLYSVTSYLGIKSGNYRYSHFECPSDKFVWYHPSEPAQTPTSGDPSYGINIRICDGVNGYPFKRIKKPHEKVLLGERTRTQEGGSGSNHTYISYEQSLYYRRHQNGGNIGWLDGRATRENMADMFTIDQNRSKYWDP